MHGPGAPSLRPGLLPPWQRWSAPTSTQARGEGPLAYMQQPCSRARGFQLAAATAAPRLLPPYPGLQGLDPALGPVKGPEPAGVSPLRALCLEVQLLDVRGRGRLPLRVVEDLAATDRGTDRAQIEDLAS